MRRTGKYSAGDGIGPKMSTAHRLLQEACEGPSEALLFGNAKRSQIKECIRKARQAAALMEEVIGD